MKLSRVADYIENHTRFDPARAATFGRYLREGKIIPTGGRGRGGINLEASHVAAIMIALAACDRAADAAETIEKLFAAPAHGRLPDKTPLPRGPNSEAALANIETELTPFKEYFSADWFSEGFDKFINSLVGEEQKTYCLSRFWKEKKGQVWISVLEPDLRLEVKIEDKHHSAIITFEEQVRDIDDGNAWRKEEKAISFKHWAFIALANCLDQHFYNED